MNKADLTLTEERIADGCYSRMAKTLNRRKFQITGRLNESQKNLTKGRFTDEDFQSLFNDSDFAVGLVAGAVGDEIPVDTRGDGVPGVVGAVPGNRAASRQGLDPVTGSGEEFNRDIIRQAVKGDVGVS